MDGSKFDFRAAAIDDLDTLFELYVEIQTVHANAEPAFCRKPQRDEIFEQFFDAILKDPDQHLVFACVDTAVVGFCQYFMGTQSEGLNRRARRMAFVNGLVVSEKFRRQGCGSALLEYVKDEAEKQGIASVGIDVWSFNTAAKACFSRAGFKVKQEYMWLNL